MPKKDRTIRLPEPDFLPKKREMLTYRDKYSPKVVRQVFFLALLGLNLEQMCQVIGVSPFALNQWLGKYPDLKQALEKGKTAADGKIAHSLYKAAKGYYYTEQVVFMKKIREFDDRGRVVSETSEPVFLDVRKYAPISVTAAVKWLQARHPNIWNDKIQIEGRLKVMHGLDLSDFNDDELKILKTLGMKNARNRVEDVDYTETE